MELIDGFTSPLHASFPAIITPRKMLDIRNDTVVKLIE